MTAFGVQLLRESDVEEGVDMEASNVRVAVVGMGYVGLVSAACYSKAGFTVVGVDVDADKIELIKRGTMPIHEPGLQEIVVACMDKGRLAFTTDLAQAVRESDVIFIAVGTPSLPDGDADLTAVRAVAREIGRSINGYKVIVDKSTVPVGTAELVKDIIDHESESIHAFDVVSNPEFLSEGSAVRDTLHPDRIVIGSDSPRATRVLLELNRSFDTKMLVTSVRTAEMIKYASNAFLATKISFINEIANLCDRVGADVVDVARGMGLDRRIGAEFLNAGLGYGGACFPKDTKALVRLGERVGCDLGIVRSAIVANEAQRDIPVRLIIERLGSDLSGRVIALLGLAFKPNTNDLRCAPSVDIARRLLDIGASVKVYDPVCSDEFTAMVRHAHVSASSSVYEAVESSDAAIVVTEWREVSGCDLRKVKALMKGRLLIDGRNCLNPELAKDLGLEYIGIGRGGFGAKHRHELALSSKTAVS